jgi:hypothetical protein
MWLCVRDREAYVVEWLGWRVASSGQKSWLSGTYVDVFVVVHADSAIGEDGSALMVADLADR